jgi:hypothetical protein
VNIMSRQHQIGGLLRTIVTAALMAGLGLTATPMLLPSTVAPALAQQPQQPAAAPIADDVRAVLSQYGNFVQHQVYGEIWIPSVTPQGWHPYPPCHWVNSKQYGWYYDDKTPWGTIVHHYGRWANDPLVGWFWVPGSEFSPGWVLWRTDLQWVGWVPRMSKSSTLIRTSSTAPTSGFSWRRRSSTTTARKRPSLPDRRAFR